MENNNVILDGEEISLEQLNEKRNTLPEGSRIVETSPGCYETVARLRG